jgi:hypothetical protein
MEVEFIELNLLELLGQPLNAIILNTVLTEVEQPEVVEAADRDEEVVG